MPEKLETPEPFARPRDKELDRDRTASMAFEGGTAAAEMELAEEMRERESKRESIVVRRPTRAWKSQLLWGALAFGAAALLTSLAMRFRRR